MPFGARQHDAIIMSNIDENLQRPGVFFVSQVWLLNTTDRAGGVFRRKKINTQTSFKA